MHRSFVQFVFPVFVLAMLSPTTDTFAQTTKLPSIGAQGSESGAEAEEAGGGLSLAKAAQKANNPLSDVWLLIAQNDTTVFDGEVLDQVGSSELLFNSLKLQPVMPVPVLDGDWNLIFRPVLQFNSVPVSDRVGELFGANLGAASLDPRVQAAIDNPFGRTNGLGDSVLLTLLGPNRDDGFVWGAGVTQIFPTATDDVLGQGKWQAGPAALAVRLGKESGHFGLESWNLGFLAQHWWSYAGDDDRDGTNQSDIQYFINWKASPTQLVGMTPNVRINWDADGGDKLSLPIGLGTIGMTRVGKLPFRWGLELQYYVVQPDDLGPQVNIKFFVAPIIANPFK